MRYTELTILALVADDRTAVAHYRLDWLHEGPFLGNPAADGRRFSLRGSDLIGVEGGRISAIYHVENLLALVRQLSPP